MAKIKKFIFVLFIVVLIPIKINAVNNEDDYEEIDYVWLEEEIKNAKEQNEPKVNSKCAVVFDRASKTIIWGKNENEEVPVLLPHAAAEKTRTHANRSIKTGSKYWWVKAWLKGRRYY